MSSRLDPSHTSGVDVVCSGEEVINDSSSRVTMETSSPYKRPPSISKCRLYTPTNQLTTSKSFASEQVNSSPGSSSTLEEDKSKTLEIQETTEMGKSSEPSSPMKPSLYQRLLSNSPPRPPSSSSSSSSADKSGSFTSKISPIPPPPSTPSPYGRPHRQDPALVNTFSYQLQTLNYTLQQERMRRIEEQTQVQRKISELQALVLDKHLNHPQISNPSKQQQREPEEEAPDTPQPENQQQSEEEQEEAEHVHHRHIRHEKPIRHQQPSRASGLSSFGSACFDLPVQQGQELTKSEQALVKIMEKQMKNQLTRLRAKLFANVLEAQDEAKNAKTQLEAFKMASEKKERQLRVEWTSQLLCEERKTTRLKREFTTKLQLLSAEMAQLKDTNTKLKEKLVLCQNHHHHHHHHPPQHTISSQKSSNSSSSQSTSHQTLKPLIYG